MIETRLLTAEDKESLVGIYGPNLDFELIKSIIYFNGWSGYDESGGLLIFLAIDDTIQSSTWFSGVDSFIMYEDFYLEEISEKEALEKIADMEEQINSPLL